MPITLNAAAITALTVGGVTKETDNSDVMINTIINYTNNNVTFNIQGGTVAGQVFTPGSNGDNIQITIDTVLGKWNSSNGMSGTLNAAAILALHNAITTFRNQGETFATANAIINGTQVAWT
jgi:hypothetical protein